MWVLIVLVASNWLAYPNLISSQKECEEGYAVIAKVFEEKKQPKPDHICAFVVYPDETPK